MRLHFYLLLVFAMLFGNYALATDRVQFQIVAEEEGAFVNYQFHVGGFQNIVGAQGTFTWDPDSIQFIEIADINVPGMNMSDFNTFNTDNGQIFFAWFTFGNGVTLEDCSTIFTLRFAILEGIAQIKSSKVPVPFEFTNSDLQRLEATDIQVDECATGGEDGGRYAPLAGGHVECAAQHRVEPQPARIVQVVVDDLHIARPVMAVGIEQCADPLAVRAVLDSEIDQPGGRPA